MNALFGHTKRLYDYMVDKSEPYINVGEKDEIRKYTGALSTAAMRELGMYPTQYNAAVNVLKTSGAAEQEKRGGGKQGSVWLIRMDKPLTEESFEITEPVRKLTADKRDALGDQLARMDKELAETTAETAALRELVEALAKEYDQLKTRVAALEAASNDDNDNEAPAPEPELTPEQVAAEAKMMKGYRGGE